MLGTIAILSALCWSAAAAGGTPPTRISVTNGTHNAVFANLVLGQPPTVNPPNCTYLGEQISSIHDARLVFMSSTGNTVIFKPQNAGITTQGYYRLAAGETITYKPSTFACTNSAGKCSPAVTFNFFFTSSRYNGSPDNGCGSGLNTRFPNATNLAEASVNFGINDYKNARNATTGLCANADATDISIVNGVNSMIELDITEVKGAAQSNTWPFYQAENEFLGGNANRVGVFGWAATNCTNSDGYPNPSAACAAPVAAPQAKNGVCHTPGGVAYDPITDPNNPTIQYCAEISDVSHNYCNIQRTGNVSGGTIAITFKGFTP
ncbi:MAG: hypothetical protein WAW37_02840 [Syntrophobacteraceae bacterium]